MKYAKKKKAALPKPKKNVSPHKNAADIRARVKAREKELRLLLPLGEFVNEKYVTASVGMIVEEVKGKRKFSHFTMAGVNPEYAARHMYYYSARVLWLEHPDKDRPQTEVIQVDYIKLRNTKKKVL
jgi:hypothetical protein